MKWEWRCVSTALGRNQITGKTHLYSRRAFLQPASAAEIPRFNVMHMFGQYSRRATMCRATQSNSRLFVEAWQAPITEQRNHFRLIQH